MNPFAFRKLSYGVYLISTLDNGRPTGCIANSAIQITSDPASIAISINHKNHTNSCIQNTGKFAVTILSEQTDPGIIGTFGFQTGKDVNKFEAVKYQLKEGLPVAEDGCAYIVCQVVDKMETDTHTVFLGKVLDADKLKDEPEMTYSYYHTVVKGKSPKNAPTYIKDEADSAPAAESRATYTCSICGYVYDGDTPFEDLPDDWKCPICKQPKSVFKKSVN